MEAPSLVLVPPSPLKYDLPSLSNSPSTSASSTTRTIASTLPESGRYSALRKEERNSSETAIFSIYSMYGDEQSNRTSWSASQNLASDPQPVVNMSATTHRLSHRISSSGESRNSLAQMNGDADDSELAYCQPYSKPPPPTRTIDLTKAAKRANGSATTARSSRTSHTGPRPSSSHATSSFAPPTLEPMENRRASTGQKYRGVDLTPSVSAPTMTPSRSEGHGHTSARYSRHIPKSVLDRELPALPPVVRVQSTTPPSRRSPSPHTPPRLASPKPNPMHLSASNSHHSLVAGPSLPSPLPLKHPPYEAGSPASNTSLVPSDGEDMDSFHVRNTYAQLEMSGVKGDGYEEGVERTRARVGASRASQAFADGALGDGTEKSMELSSKEIQTLAALDRYGFFSTPSHDRLVLLPSAPLVKRLSITTPGPSKAPTSATSLSTLPPTPQPTKESSRIAKWTRMLLPQSRDMGGNVETWTVKPSKEAKFRERAYKGIPDRWRHAAWELMMSRFSKLGAAQMASLGAEYREALDKPSSYDIQIDLDVPRTISGHVMFRTRYGAGQRSLFHVLHSFSLRCDQCGYVQGMGPIAATLLCYFEPERVYASLVRLHDAYSMHTIFSPGFPGLLEAIYVQERIIEQMMPGVYAAFQKHMISTTSYATKWYITLFANSVPFQTQLRFWDVFLLEGQDVFVAVAVSIVWVYRDQITSNAANFETVLSLLSSFFVVEDENVLLAWIGKTLGDQKLRANMRQWRADWQNLVATGKEGDALL